MNIVSHQSKSPPPPLPGAAVEADAEAGAVTDKAAEALCKFAPAWPVVSALAGTVMV